MTIEDAHIRPSRRGFLKGVGAVGAGLLASSVGPATSATADPAVRPVGPEAPPALRPGGAEEQHEHRADLRRPATVRRCE